MEHTELISAHFSENYQVTAAAFEQLAQPIAAAIDCLLGCLMNNGKILACGNGGSAADAQHFVAELVGRFEKERPGLAAVTLSCDSSIMTAVGNDYGYPQVFSRQVQALGQAGDVLLAISTSGNSANVITAIQMAQQHQLRVVALTGGDGGKIAAMMTAADIHLCVPSKRTARIQEVHGLIIHCLCDGIDQVLIGE